MPQWLDSKHFVTFNVFFFLLLFLVLQKAVKNHKLPTPLWGQLASLRRHRQPTSGDPATAECTEVASKLVEALVMAPLRGTHVAMGQNPNRTSEHPNPTTQIAKMSGAPTPKWYHWF